jgi:two-component system, OmpR family, copper resistance phosphate regulon response regulator CusR
MNLSADLRFPGHQMFESIYTRARSQRRLGRFLSFSQKVFRNTSGGGKPIELIQKRGSIVRILLVEDEGKVGNALSQGLQAEGYDVIWAQTGEEGFFHASSQVFDLIVLDVMLPGRDGIEVLQTLRKKGSTIPVLLLTAKDAIEDRVLGLDAGADDYLVKPFAFAELSARLRALLRRNKPETAAELLIIEALEIDPIRRTVSREGQRIDLTVREFELLEYLARNHDRVVSREMLARDVWKESGRATPLDNVIDVHVARLRKKMDDPFEVKLLHTVRGVGFTLSEDGS